MASQKRNGSSSDCYLGRDRLSEMPDEVLVHILSFMPTFDAVRTMLIRRFGNLWTLLPNLEIVADEFPNSMTYDHRRFCIYVRNVLKLHRRPFIDKFHLSLSERETEEFKVGNDAIMWLRFALDKQAKDIYLYEFEIGFDATFNFPIFSSQSLVKLELFGCEIDKQLQVNLGSLRKLKLEYVIIEDEFQQFISGCPSLQEWSILTGGFHTIWDLKLSAPNLRKFSFYEEECRSSWLFDFPNLESLSLDLEGIPDITDVSSVRDVNFESLFLREDDANERRRCKMFLEKFSCSEVFKSSWDASKALFHVMDDLQFSQIRWKRVVLDLRVFCDSCLRGIYELTRSLKHLEELILYIKNPLIDNSYNPLPWEDSFPCEIPKLKTVVIHGYGSVEPYDRGNRQLQLIEFLLKSAVALDKLEIVKSKHELKATTAMLDFIKHVSSFQRSSPTARIIFA